MAKNAMVIKEVLEMLKMSPLKLTSQRKKLIKIIFANGDGHYTAEDVFKKAKQNKVKISLATVYNTLNSFKKCGILNIVKTSSDKIYFDTNLKEHHHFFCKETGELIDIKSSKIFISKLPKTPNRKKVSSVNVIIDIYNNSI